MIDAAIRHTSNTDVAGGSYTGFSQGLFNGSRFGLKGSEDLEGGLKAVFTLEELTSLEPVPGAPAPALASSAGVE